MAFWETVSLLSGLLQAVGYLLYFRGSLRSEILPNPTTWLLFAYDTTILVLLHATLGAEPMLLLLPAVCATCSIGVAVLSWARVGFAWPAQGVDRTALFACVALTAAYVALSIMGHHGWISAGLHRAAAIAILVFSNASTAVSFLPLLHSVRRHPASERPAPWLIWALAYLLLLMATLAIHGWNELELVLYPICNLALHLAVAVLAAPARLAAVSRADRSGSSPPAPAHLPALPPQPGAWPRRVAARPAAAPPAVRRR